MKFTEFLFLFHKVESAVVKCRCAINSSVCTPVANVERTGFYGALYEHHATAVATWRHCEHSNLERQ